MLLAIAGSQPWGDNGQGTLREFTPSGWVTRGSINLPLWRGDAHLVVGGRDQQHHARQLRDHGGREHLQRVRVPHRCCAPLRPGSLSIQFARAVGGTQTVTAGIDGTITASGVIRQRRLRHRPGARAFGTVVTAAGQRGEPWFDAENVRPDGKIFRPEPVAASSLRYSAVAYSYLPLDAALLGIDPVRLPSDGRCRSSVPEASPSSATPVASPPRSATARPSTARGCACRARVVGHDGVVIHTGYVTDLEAGTVTFTDVTGYSQPVTIEHRIEDMAVVRDVQINGEISFTRPLTHAYPLASPAIRSLAVSSPVRWWPVTCSPA